MELLTILLLGTLLIGFEIFFHFRRVQTYKDLTNLTDSVGIAVARLKEGKKYIISLSDTLSDEEFEDAVEVMRKSLDLENSNIHIVIVQGNVTLVEFS